MVDSGARCKGSAVQVRGIVTLEDCASKCGEMKTEGTPLIYFMRRSKTKCDGPKCECKCFTKIKTEEDCTIESANWDLYKYLGTGKYLI